MSKVPSWLGNLNMNAISWQMCLKSAFILKSAPLCIPAILMNYELSWTKSNIISIFTLHFMRSTLNAFQKWITSRFILHKQKLYKNINNLISCFHSALSSGSSGICAQSCARTYVNCAIFESKYCTSETNIEVKQNIVNKMHPFLKYIWISDRKSSILIYP